MSDHYTKQSDIGFIPDGPDAVAEARKMHHLASADPEPERDGLLTGPAHEEKHGLERADDSAAIWRAAGVHPTENRALVEGDEGFDSGIETTSAAKAPETTAAPRASDKK